MIFKELAHVTCVSTSSAASWPETRARTQWHCPGSAGKMQSFRPLQRHTVNQCGTRALVHSWVARFWPGQRRGQINWLETLRYKHLFRTRFRVSCLHSHCYIWTMSFTLTLCPGWRGPPPVLTCHYVGWAQGGQYPGAGHWPVTRPGDHPWPQEGRSGGPARGLLLSNEVLLQLILPSLGRSQPRQWQTISINYFSIPLHPQYYLPFQCSTMVLNDT